MIAFLAGPRLCFQRQGDRQSAMISPTDAIVPAAAGPSSPKLPFLAFGVRHGACRPGRLVSAAAGRSCWVRIRWWGSARGGAGERWRAA